MSDPVEIIVPAPVTIDVTVSGVGVKGDPGPALPDLDPSPAGTYTNATVTVDAKGRVTNAASGTGGGPGGSVSAATAAALGTVKIDGTPTDPANPTVYVTEEVDARLAEKEATGAAAALLAAHEGATDPHPQYATVARVDAVEDASVDGDAALLAQLDGTDAAVADHETRLAALEALPPGGATIAVDDEGSEVTAAAGRLNFVGAGVTADEAGGTVTVAIPDGGGGGGASAQWFQNALNAATSTLHLAKGVLLEPTASVTLYGFGIVTDDAGTQTLRLRVYELDAGGLQVGAALYESAALTGPGATTYTIAMLGTPLTLTAGHRYALVVVNTTGGASFVRAFSGTGARDPRIGYTGQFARHASASPASGAAWDLGANAYAYSVLAPTGA